VCGDLPPVVDDHDDDEGQVDEGDDDPATPDHDDVVVDNFPADQDDVWQFDEEDDAPAAPAHGDAVDDNLPDPHRHRLAARDLPTSSRAGHDDSAVPCRRRRLVTHHDMQSNTKQKHAKRRWTREERDMLFEMFGAELTKKSMPSGLRIAELAKRMGTRTVMQIRSQLSNYICGKLKLG